MRRWVAAVMLTLGCAPYDVVVVRLPTTDGGTPCARTEECPVGFSCQRSQCEDLSGYCERVPPVCDAEADPVCGCDGVSYWNDCLRRNQGVTAAVPGACVAGLSCREHSECPDRSSCAFLLTSRADCGRDVESGTCWRAPAECSRTALMEGWSLCTGEGEAGQCIDTCRAMLMGSPVFPTRCE